MAINKEISAQVARRADIASVTISVSVSLYNIADCLEAIQAGNRVDDDALKKIRDIADELQKRYDALVGWTEDAS